MFFISNENRLNSFFFFLISYFKHIINTCVQSSFFLLIIPFGTLSCHWINFNLSEFFASPSHPPSYSMPQRVKQCVCVFKQLDKLALGDAYFFAQNWNDLVDIIKHADRRTNLHSHRKGGGEEVYEGSSLVGASAYSSIWLAKGNFKVIVLRP